MDKQILTKSAEKIKGLMATSAPHSVQGMLPSSILQLQRTLGNGVVAKLIQAKCFTPEGKIIGLQPMLTVGAADDQYEQKADRVDRQVMSMPEATAVNPIQRATSPEEDKDQTLRTKHGNDVLSRHFDEEKKEETNPVQGRFEPASTDALQTKQETQQNKTGLPDYLKSGLENLSNIDLSGVRVHYNSSKPAQLGALAYTQGQEIHIGDGQENYLPHEGWHAVQQIQGRVSSTKQKKGLPVNDDTNLEREADVMGAEALQMAQAKQETTLLRTTSIQKKEEVAQFALPAIVAGMGAAEWIAAGALGYQVTSDAVNSTSGDISYTFDEMEGVLLSGGGNDIPAYRAAHPSNRIYEATHRLAVWFGTSGSRKMGIKFGITFLYDGNALGNISLSIIDTYDWPGWAGSVNVNITPRSLTTGAASVRLTVNMGTNNSWFNRDHTGNQIFILRADGDLTRTSTTGGYHHIS